MLELLQKLEQECGLSHSRLGYYRHESPTALDAVKKRCQGLSMRRAEIKVARIGSHTERLIR
jgi:hypothetical protein